MVLSDWRPQGNESPGTTVDHVVAAPTCAGRARSTVSPVPSWPEELSPQHHRLASNLIAQVCVAPTRTPEFQSASPTWAGLAAMAGSARPVWPSSLSPQAYSE